MFDYQKVLKVIEWNSCKRGGFIWSRRQLTVEDGDLYGWTKKIGVSSQTGWGVRVGWEAAGSDGLEYV